MKTIKHASLITLILFFFQQTSTSQSLNLFEDYHEGAPDAISEFNYTSVRLGNKLFFPAKNALHGEELCYLENDKISLLKDIKPGAANGGIKNLLIANEKLYFLAYDSTSNSRHLWESDGTADGTKILVKATGNNYISDLFTFNNNLYYSDSKHTYYIKDNQPKLIHSNVTIDEYTVCKYKNGIAFSFKTSVNDSLKIMAFYNDTLRTLGKTMLDDYTRLSYLAEVEGGVIASSDKSFSSNRSGTYFYSDKTKLIKKINANYILRIARNDNTNNHLLLLSDGDFYVVKNGNLTFLADGDTGLTQGEALPYAVIGNYILALGSDATFNSNKYFILTDGIDFKKLYNFTTSSASSIVTSNNNFYVALGIWNGSQPEILEISTTTLNMKKLLSLSESSLDGPSLLLHAVYNDQLIVTSNLDQTIGRELYGLNLDLTSNLESNIETFKLLERGDEFSVSMPVNKSITVELFDLSGKLIQKSVLYSNQWFGKYKSNMPVLYIVRDENKAVHKIMYNCK